MLPRLLAVVVCASLSAGCGSEPAQVALREGEAAQVRVHQRHVDRADGMLYSEGFLQFAEFSTPRQETVQVEVTKEPREHSLPAGRYTLTSHSRICSGNCSELDQGQVDPCELELEIAPGTTTELVVVTQVETACKIEER